MTLSDFAGIAGGKGGFATGRHHVYRQRPAVGRSHALGSLPSHQLGGKRLETEDKAVSNAGVRAVSRWERIEKIGLSESAFGRL